MLNDETEQAEILKAAMEFVEKHASVGTRYAGWRPDRWIDVAYVLYRALKDQKPAPDAPRHAPPLDPGMTWEQQPGGHYAREVKT